jgi:hypothetical protein
MTDRTDPLTGETHRCLLTEAVDVKAEMREYFARWFGKLKAKWYRTASATHILFRDDEVGADARRALVRGQLDEHQS